MAMPRKAYMKFQTKHNDNVARSYLKCYENATECTMHRLYLKIQTHPQLGRDMHFPSTFHSPCGLRLIDPPKMFAGPTSTWFLRACLIVTLARHHCFQLLTDNIDTGLW